MALNNVCKSFGDVEVIHNVSVSVPKGTFLVLVGPSGCGKSTLLRMIAGLEGVTSGEVCIDDQIVNDVPPKQRDIAMVFQSYALYPHMTVAENMGFSLKLRRVDKHETTEKVARAAQILGLEDYLDRYPRQLSGGQRQRVAMGRAIVRDPEIFLFDEPLSNLDAKLRGQMRVELRELHQKLGNTMVYVTHDQIEAMTMADQILVLKDGKTEQIGTPIELYDSPANLFVAQFIGSQSMNVFRGRIDGTDLLSQDSPPMPLPAWVARYTGQEVAIGIRPKHLEIVDDGCDGFRAQIESAEITGADVFLRMRCGVQDFSVSYRDPLPSMADESIARQRLRFDRGDEVVVAPRQIHVFDAETGKRM